MNHHIDRRTVLLGSAGAATTGLFPPDAHAAGGFVRLGMNQWMKGLSNDTLLHRLTLPGTHDSCANVNVGLSTPWARCQDMTITQQLSAGVRAFDLRVRLNPAGDQHNVFRLFHGDFPLGLNLHQVFNQMDAFLRDNPSEALVISLKREGGVGTANAWRKAWQRFGDSRWWRLVTDARSHPLRELRGKVYVLSREPGVIPGLSWTRLIVQDDWQQSDGVTKWNGCRKNLDKAVASPWRRYEYFVTFLSANSAGSTIRQMAWESPYTEWDGKFWDGMNHALERRINRQRGLGGPGRTMGIIFQDYPAGWGIRQIAAFNYNRADVP